MTSIPPDTKDELEGQLRARPYRQTSVLELTSAPVAKWDKSLQSGSKILWKASLEDWRLL